MTKVANGKYLALSTKRGAAVEIGGKLAIYNGKRDHTFFRRLARWICEKFGINAKNPTIEIRKGSLSSIAGHNEIIINSNSTEDGE